ncbi:hypothetical protein T484DRAFT_1910388, partial [Baffinella frigidus]
MFSGCFGLALFLGFHVVWLRAVIKALVEDSPRTRRLPHPSGDAATGRSWYSCMYSVPPFLAEPERYVTTSPRASSPTRASSPSRATSSPKGPHTPNAGTGRQLPTVHAGCPPTVHAGKWAVDST